MKLSENVKKYIIPPIVILMVVMLLEVFLFNFRHWLTLGNDPVYVDNWVSSPNTSALDKDAFIVDSTADGTLTYIEVSGLDIDLNSIYFDFIDLEKGEYGFAEIPYHLELTDAGDAIPYQTPSKVFLRPYTKYHYTSVNPFGNANSVRVCFDKLVEGSSLRVAAFILNPKIELMVSKKRVLFMFVLLIILFAVRPGSSFYALETCAEFKGKKTVIAVLLIAEIASFFVITRMNTWYANVPEGGNTQYMQLAEAIVDRHDVFLAAIPPEGMDQMDDVYDAVLRRSIFSENSDVGDMSDTGFYKGRYFVYFGVAPILLFYVPVYAITGHHIMTRTVVFIECGLIALAVLFFLYELCRRYFRKMPFVFYLMSSVLFTYGAGELFMAVDPNFYAVPLLFALMCILFGMGFWLLALNSEKMSAAVLALGSLFMALPAASRPQFLIASFLAIVIFWNAVFKERTLLSNSSIPQTIAFMAPFIVVAAGVMYYNYIRFENVFEFGASFNLCYHNMPYRGFRIDRTLHAVVGMLFHPCVVNNEFPFFQLSDYVNGYMGISSDEDLIGGVFYNNPYLLIVFFPFVLRKVIEKKDAFILTVVCPVITFIVMLVDANMSGVLPRYAGDFVWAYMMSAFILLGYLYLSGGVGVAKADAALSEEAKASITTRSQYIIRWVYFVLFVYTVIRLMLMIFYGDGMYNNNMGLFYRIKGLVEFWN